MSRKRLALTVVLEKYLGGVEGEKLSRLPRTAPIPTSSPTLPLILLAPLPPLPTAPSPRWRNFTPTDRNSFILQNCFSHYLLKSDGAPALGKYMEWERRVCANLQRVHPFPHFPTDKLHNIWGNRRRIRSGNHHGNTTKAKAHLQSGFWILSGVKYYDVHASMPPSDNIAIAFHNVIHIHFKSFDITFDKSPCVTDKLSGFFIVIVLRPCLAHVKKLRNLYIGWEMLLFYVVSTRKGRNRFMNFLNVRYFNSGASGARNAVTLESEEHMWAEHDTVFRSRSPRFIVQFTKTHLLVVVVGWLDVIFSAGVG